jgi:hypothetical protein
MDVTLTQIGLALAEATTLQASMVQSQVAEYAARCWACSACGMLQPLKDRRTRRIQTLFDTAIVLASRLRVCRCR